jgi:hypothetical protein
MGFHSVGILQHFFACCGTKNKSTLLATMSKKNGAEPNQNMRHRIPIGKKVELYSTVGKMALILLKT